MNDDITFCMNGWKECLVTRCERHPYNISDKRIPHSFAKLYRTEYCPLEIPKVADMVEVVRCRDCKYNRNPPSAGNALCDNFYGMTDQNGFCHFGERRTDGTAD